MSKGPLSCSSAGGRKSAMCGLSSELMPPHLLFQAFPPRKFNWVKLICKIRRIKMIN